MRIVCALSMPLACSLACNDSTSPSSAPSSPSTVPLPIVIGIYSATLPASPTCVPRLPANVTPRMYLATFQDNGDIIWSAPTVHPPQGHETRSSGSFSGSRFSFSLGVPHDIQSDAFNGIWDTLSVSSYLTIEGQGDGMVQGTSISGAFKGLFVYYERDNVTGCDASDHRFNFTKQ